MIKGRCPGKGLFSGIRLIALAIFIALTIMVTAGTALAADSDFNAQEAGHPLRIIAYAAHPVGVIIEYTLFRPAYWIGNKEPFKTIFGQKAEFGQGSRVGQPKG